MKKIEQSSIVDLSENSKLSEKIENWPNWSRWSRAQYSKGGSARFWKYQEFSHFDVSEKCCRWSPQAWFRYVRFNWVWNKTLLHKWPSQTPHYIFWWMLNVAQSTILEEGSILNSASIQTWSISNILQEINSSSKMINLSFSSSTLFLTFGWFKMRLKFKKVIFTLD